MLGMIVPKSTLKVKRMQDLLKKEKKLHKEIHQDYEKISEKITDDFDKIQKLKTKTYCSLSESFDDVISEF